jgi:hypothetical protein
MKGSDLVKLEERTKAVCELVEGISFDEDQGAIFSKLIALELPGLLCDLRAELDLASSSGSTPAHKTLDIYHSWLRRKWNVAFLFSAVGSLMGVSIMLTYPERNEPVDYLTTHETVLRILDDADTAIGEIRTNEANDVGSQFERILQPYRKMAGDLETKGAAEAMAALAGQ